MSKYPGLPKNTFSFVYEIFNVLTLVFLITEFSVPTTVQSVSVSFSARDFVQFVTPGNWLLCGEVSRSQRTAHVLAVLIWWSIRTIQFQTLSCVKSVKLRSGRAGMLIVMPRF